MPKRSATKRKRKDSGVVDQRPADVESDNIQYAALADPTVKDEEEKELEDLLFGGEEDFVENITQSGDRKSKKLREKKPEAEAPKVAWQDDEDENAAVAADKLLEPNWAKSDREKSEDSDDSDTEGTSLLRRTGDYLPTSAALPKSEIQMKKCKDANKDRPCQGKLKSVEFHPYAQVLLAAGMDHSLNLFQVDGKNNPKIQSIFLEKFPVHSAHFSGDGNEVFASSRHKFCYYDMIAGKVVRVPPVKGMEERNLQRMIVSPDGKFIVFLGKYGAMHFLSAKSKEWIDSIQMNGTIESAAFTSDGSKLFSIGGDGEAYVWDVNSRSLVHRFHDEGCITGMSVAVSPNNKYVAIGANTGVVNIYDETCLQSAHPTPIKAITNLDCEASILKFNSTSEILAMASNQTEQALKFLHVPSLSIFKNFPDRTEGLRIPYTMDFSVNSGYFCVGNHRGNALLFRVKHYSSY